MRDRRDRRDRHDNHGKQRATQDCQGLTDRPVWHGAPAQATGKTVQPRRGASARQRDAAQRKGNGKRCDGEVDAMRRAPGARQTTLWHPGEATDRTRLACCRRTDDKNGNRGRENKVYMQAGGWR